MGWARHAPRQPLKKHPSGHLGGWATQRPAEEMLDGQCLKSGHINTCQNYSKTGRGPLLNRPSCSPPPSPANDPVSRGTELNWTELIESYIFTPGLMTLQSQRRGRSWSSGFFFPVLNVGRFNILLKLVSFSFDNIFFFFFSRQKRTAVVPC